MKKKFDPLSWSQRLSSKLVEAIKTGILLTDREGRIRFANSLALEMFGYSSENLIGESIDTLFLSDDTEVLVPNIMKLTLQGPGFDGEALLRRQDGSTFFVNLSTALYKEESPDYDLMIVTVQDITHLKEMEKDRLGVERFAGLGMMTDQISHQIRNPIVSIGGFALRLAREQVSSDEYAQYSRIIHNEAKRLEYIIERLVEFARVPTAHYDALTLSQVFEGVGAITGSQSGHDHNRVILPDPAALPDTVLYGDLALLIKATHCVIQNGLEAGNGNGTVILRGHITERQASIAVIDNGEGITPEHLPFIFDPFFSTKFNCLGLGLTLARRIIQEHKGRIEVDTCRDKGTEVHMVLPRDRRREIRTKRL